MQPRQSTHVDVPEREARWSAAALARVVWTCTTIFVVQAFVCALAACPVLLGWQLLTAWTDGSLLLRLAMFSLAAVPSYALFALLLMPVSALTSRLLGWRTPSDAEMRIAAMDWMLMTWVRAMAAIHVVRFFSGTFYRGSPLWTMYLRLAGARVGRRVYVNSLALSDYNLLEFGDDVVIGGDVHLAGHTVERGVVKTARVRLGAKVTIGLGSVIDIGVEAGRGCQVGALSLVPKYSRLEAGAVYVGVPVRRIS